MRAVILNSGTYGSTGKIASSLGRYLKSAGHQVLYCYARGGAPEGVTGSRFESFPEVLIHGGLTRVTGWQGVFSTLATARLIRRLEKFQAQVYYLENLHGYYLNERMLFRFLGRTGARVVYLMLDEYPFLGRCGYSFRCDAFQHGCGHCKQKNVYPKTWFFDWSAQIYRRKKENYDAVAQLCFVGIEYTVNRARLSPMMDGRSFYIADEAVDLRNIYYPRDPQALRRQLGIPKEKKIALCVSPFSDPRKGCRYFLEAARMLEGDPSTVLVHVGVDRTIPDAPANFLPKGIIRDQDLLCQYYSMADVLVCPSLAETIPAVCIEALSCGTPVIGFHISGLPSCADSEHGVFVEPENSAALARAIAQAPKKTEDRIRSCRRYAEKRYDNQIFHEKMEALGRDGWERNTDEQ